MKYKVLKEFRLLDDPKVPGIGEVVPKDEIIDITVKRANSVEKTLGSSFLERVNEEE